MAQRVSGIDDGIFEDADEEAGERSDHLDALAFERVADDTDDVAFVHEFAAGAMPCRPSPFVRTNPRPFVVRFHDGPPSGPADEFLFVDPYSAKTLFTPSKACWMRPRSKR